MSSPAGNYHLDGVGYCEVIGNIYENPDIIPKQRVSVGSPLVSPCQKEVE
jgi:hypothetical protein